MSALATWTRAKAECPKGYVLLVRVLDFYVAFGLDALVVASALGMRAYRSEGCDKFGVPYTEIERALETLLRLGKKVALADEIDAPRSQFVIDTITQKDKVGDEEREKEPIPRE